MTYCLFYFQIQNDAEKEIGNQGNGLSDNSKNIAGLSQRLAQVTAERDQLRNQKDHDQDWESQCQRYEERMVELHSVIAELSRKLDIGKYFGIFLKHSAILQNKVAKSVFWRFLAIFDIKCEEQMVELHSVNAEISRKLDIG